MLAQADDVTGTKPLFCPQRLAVPRDQGARLPARLEGRGAAVAVATEAAVPRKDVGGGEVEIDLRAFVTFAGSAEPNARPGEQVDDKVLEGT